MLGLHNIPKPFLDQFTSFLELDNGLLLIIGGKSTGKTTTILAGYDYLTSLGHEVLFFDDYHDHESLSNNDIAIFENMLAFEAKKILIDGHESHEFLRQAFELSKEKLVAITLETQSSMQAFNKFVQAGTVDNLESIKNPIMFIEHGYILGSFDTGSPIRLHTIN